LDEGAPLRATVRILPEALQQVADADDWWREHRADAPYLFAEEWDQALSLLEEQPEAGHLAPRGRLRNLRVLLLKETLRHVYYDFDAAAGEVLIRAVWGAVRGRPPPLRHR